MSIDVHNLVDPDISCASCKADCCKLEVMLITDTGVPREYISEDRWGAETMTRLADGWCAALDRSTMMCRIYEHRPWICREFEMGAQDCQVERLKAD
ncbi:MAG: YkgJ family cysteine cluster protein [Porticoccaceae bacterium]|nr:YkgJ family cysteine cluster protein [Porticoccaceae bacterium]MBT5577819.1 YkgJ family cysteine cluster protein [Porticoccaceae bacterium]MBT7374401.1 YkgJ family cysteine cluster protein [Porticoccaceae bacterium]